MMLSPDSRYFSQEDDTEESAHTCIGWCVLALLWTKRRTLIMTTSAVMCAKEIVDKEQYSYCYYAQVYTPCVIVKWGL